MNVHEAIRTRSSVREFLPDFVPEESLGRVLEAARLAPSSSNRQEWRFIVVRDAERRRRLSLVANNQTWIADAPVIIAAVATDPSSVMTCGVPRYAVDVSIAVDHITLAAVEEGLGTCWIGAFSQEGARAVLGVEPDCMVVTLMPLGYPVSGTHAAKSRKPLEAIVRYEQDRQ